MLVVLIEFGIAISIVAILVSTVWMKYELDMLLRTGDYNQIYINKNGKWHISDQKGDNTVLGFHNWIRIGPALFLLVTHQGRKKRVLVLENQQDSAIFHRLRIYLLATNLK